MKSHAIIPIFIPHNGCPNDCVFCNQRRITSRMASPTEYEVRCIIDEWMTTLENVPSVSIAFYGGSFTAIPIDEQKRYLRIAAEYKAAGRVSEIHLSTRPDCINDEILDVLRAHKVDLIELGCQSFDEGVLRAVKRGHGVDAIYEACELIKSNGFRLGIQLMVGLPGSSLEIDVESARLAGELKPEVARIYPTIVIEDTELLDMVISDEYTPLSISEAVSRSKEMLKILRSYDVNVIRIGLKASDLISGDGHLTGTTFHPAFRQLVEGEIARDEIETQLEHALGNMLPKVIEFGIRNDKTRKQQFKPVFIATCTAAPGCLSNLVGHKGSNRSYFVDKYPHIRFVFKEAPSLDKGKYSLQLSPV